MTNMNNFNADRFQFVKSMNDIVRHMDDENAIDIWLHFVPDDAIDEDFQFIADDEELFDNAVFLFEDLMKQFIGNGIYIGKTHY